jgi:ABC-type transporter Mla subunit MlaD
VKKIKLGKTALWILGIGFFIIASAVLLMLHAGQSGDVEQLEDNLAVTQTVLTTLTLEREDLDSQLTQLNNQLDEAEAAYSQSQANFPEAVMSIEHDEELFLIADDYNLEVMSLTASEPRENKVEGIPFDNTIFEVKVRGEVSNILSFINNVTTGGYFDSATVELVNMEVPEPDEEGQPSAVIKLIIYSYEGE